MNSIIKLIDSKIITGLSVQKLNLNTKYIFKVTKITKTLENMVKINGISYKGFGYLGSKLNLLDFIGDSIKMYTKKELNGIESFGDLFSGTGVMSFFMIENGCKKIVINDIQYYANIVSSILTKENIDIDKIKKIIKTINERCNLLTEKDITKNDFICNNYTEYGKEKRMYFSILNGLKIDRSRQMIEENKKDLSDKEYNFLLKILLFAVTCISNTASVYAAYLKKYKECSLKQLILDINLLDNLSSKEKVILESFNEDISVLLDTRDFNEIELVYIDSPYNNRNYDSNYHLLETIALNDNPTIRGKTGLRNDSTKKSKFCSKVDAAKEFKKILCKLQSNYVAISYSSESIVSKDLLVSILNETWSNVICYEKDYSRFKSNNNSKQSKTVTEYLFCATKKK